ncbi:hypothetical protein TWF694_003726 [Orbilia ellipsospora]|uniref:Uncharacterized protein n=1 Tax=Orbilia ellipsospora TaxID=2528407 RepID=A0AAV9WZ34_9PEZI
MLLLILSLILGLSALTYGQLDWGGVGVWVTIKSEPFYQGDGPLQVAAEKVTGGEAGDGGACFAIYGSDVGPGKNLTIIVKSLEVFNGICYFYGPETDGCFGRLYANQLPEAKFALADGAIPDASDSKAALGVDDATINSFICWS